MPEKAKKTFDYTLWALLAILLVNALLKWRFFCGLTQADDFSYGVYSYSFFRLPLPWDMSMDFRALRLSLLLPVSLLFRIFGLSEFIAILYPMLLSFVTIVLGFLIGRKLYGPYAGMLGAFVLATFPGDVVYGTMLLPDTIVPFYLALAVWAFLTAEESRGSKAKWWYLLVGVSVFLAFNARENSYYFLLFFLPFAFSSSRWKRGLYLVGAGFAAPVLLLYLVYAFKSGDFLFNIHLAEHQRDPLIQSGYIPKNSLNWFTNLRYMFPGFFQGMDGKLPFLSSLFGYTFYFGILCVGYAAWKGISRRSWKLLIVPWWFLIGYLFLEFGSVSFTSFQMMVKLPRFLLTVTPPMAIACGLVMNDALGLGARKVRRLSDFKIRWVGGGIALAALAWLLFTSYGAARGQKDSLAYNMHQYRWAYREVLKNRPHLPLYGTGGWWWNKLSLWYLPDIRFADMPWRRSDMLRDLKAVKNPTDLGGSYIILDRTNFTGQNDLRIRHSYDDFGTWVLLPPREWKLLGDSEHVEIYEVPAGWTYRETDGKELANGSLLFALSEDDPMLFLYNLHPDFLAKLTQEKFWGLFNVLKNTADPQRADLLNNRLEYKENKGKWKILFKLD
ncbi:MAG: glycosyltransferase family 39 protein [Candidatus Latescibacter sp.]|nr:glycosyltransferase family 39 protein [Candidatus Latescibacter sp.]